MPRKKKNPPLHHKRLQITDSSGWTHITSSLSKLHLHNQKDPLPTLQPAPIPSGQSLLHLQKQHAQYRSKWLSSPCYLTIRKLFLEDIGLRELGKERYVDNCVVLGLGSLSNGRRSSWWELVFLESVLELLSPSPPSSPASPSPSQVTEAKPHSTEAHDSDITLEDRDEHTQETRRMRIYIQDPILNPLDHTFLSTLTYTTLPHPLAFAQITSSTILFAPHLELSIYRQALNTSTLPRICVGTDMQECVDRTEVVDGEDSSLAGGEGDRGEVFKRYMEMTASRPLPDFERDDWMFFTRVYWMKGRESDARE